MNLTISEYLRDMVQNEGQEYLLEETRVYGCLADVFPGFKRERSILTLSIKMGYPSKLERVLKETSADARNAIIQKLAAQFCDEGWITHEAAVYALSILAYAKGYITNINVLDITNNVESLDELYEQNQLLQKKNDHLQKQIALLEHRIDELQADIYTKKQNTFSVFKVEEKDVQLLRKQINGSDLRFIVSCSKAFLSSQDHEVAKLGRDMLSIAAEKGDAEAQLLQGELYLSDKDMVNSYFWLYKAAENGNKEALYKLGMMCGMSGRYSEAIEWFRKAAEDGNTKAQLQYGIMLQSGIGVEKNQQAALQWFRRSANAGNKEAEKRYQRLRSSIDRI